MAEFKFITNKEIVETTILGGNVDSTKYSFCIDEAQIMVLEPMLGTELYNKISSDLEGEVLSGDYLVVFNEFIKPITIYSSLAAYLTIAPFKLDNGGVFKPTPSNAESVDREDVSDLQDRYNNLAQTYVLRFEKWISKNKLDEYKTSQDEVDATNVQLNSGWYFGSEDVDKTDYTPNER